MVILNAVDWWILFLIIPISIVCFIPAIVCIAKKQEKIKPTNKEKVVVVKDSLFNDSHTQYLSEIISFLFDLDDQDDGVVNKKIEILKH